MTDTLVARSVETNQDRDLRARASAAVRELASASSTDLVPRPVLAPVDLGTTVLEWKLSGQYGCVPQ